MKRGKIAVFLAMVLSLGCLAACRTGAEGGSVREGFSYSFVRQGDGYRLTFGADGEEYQTLAGAVGVRFDRTANTTNDPVYKDYDSVEKTEGGYRAEALVSSERGSQVKIVDWYYAVEDALEVAREIEVVKAGRDNGFATEFTFLTENASTVSESEWFNPAQYYLNGTHTLMNSTTRTNFSRERAVICGDYTSAVLISRLHGGVSTTLYDLTDTRQETTAEDNTSSPHLMIDEHFNMTGVGFGNDFCEDEKTRVSMSFYYPSHSQLWSSSDTVWRLLPVEEGICRTVRFAIRIEKHDDYASMMNDVFRDYYERIAVTERRYDQGEVYDVLIENIQNSYRAVNDWGAIPQYYVNYDHHFPESGFLYRNLDTALLMYKEGLRSGNREYMDTAAEVMRYQLQYDKLDTGITSNTGIVRRRNRYEGFAALLQTYFCFLEAGDPYKNSVIGCDQIRDYLLNKAETYKDEDSILGLIFYIPLWKAQEKLGVDYSQTALALLDKLAAENIDFSGYFGSVDSTDPYISVAEDYMIILQAYIGAYEITGVERWLDLAVKAATMLETFQVIHPIQLQPYGETGAQGLKSTFIGNERFTARGYSFNNTGHCILDTGTVGATVDYYKLYEYTGDRHFLDVAEYKLYNASIYINMGDKVGYMDDLVHSAGMGFANEFVGNCANVSSAEDSGMRGAAHDSALPWYTHQMLYVYDYFLGRFGDVIPDEMSSGGYDLARRAYTSASSSAGGAFGSWNAVDGLDSTLWKPASGDAERILLVDLNEYCILSDISVKTAGGSAEIFVSQDGEDWQPYASGGKVYARYVRVRPDQSAEGIFSVQVDGVPVRYQTLSYDAEIVSASGSSVGSATDSARGGGNYVTAWNAGSTSYTAVMVLDLGQVREIFQTALKFASPQTLQFDTYAANYADNIYDPAVGRYAYTIEMSEDGENWMPYASVNDTRLVFVDSGYCRARFVRLTLLGGEGNTYLLSDFKVMGIG